MRSSYQRPSVREPGMPRVLANDLVLMLYLLRLISGQTHSRALGLLYP